MAARLSSRCTRCIQLGCHARRQLTQPPSSRLWLRVVVRERVREQEMPARPTVQPLPTWPLLHEAIDNVKDAMKS